MNCKVCGTRLGILERWRYGDFCSQEHKTVFADDLENLNRQLTTDPAPKGRKSDTGKGAAAKAGSGGAKQAEQAPKEAGAEVAATPDTELEPAMAEFVQQVDAKPHRPLRLEEKRENKPAAERTEKTSELWRLLAKRAEQEAIPATALTAGAWRQNHPVIVISSAQESQQGPGGYYMAAAYPAVAPAGQMLTQGGRMPQGGLTGVSEGFWGPAFAVGMPHVPAQPKHWVDDQGWHWISDASAQTIPTVENILAAYPMAAPWAQWPMMAPGMMGAGMMSPGAMGNPTASMSQPGGAGAPQMGSGPMGAGGNTQRGGAPQGGMPGANPGVAGVPGAAGIGGMAPGGIGFGSPGPGGAQGMAGGIFGGGQMMGWGGSPAMTTGPLPQGGPGYHWRELPPPFFSALVDLSHGVQPLASEIAVAAPAVVMEDWPKASPKCPSPVWTLGAELAVGRPECVQTRICRGAIPPAADFTLGATWVAMALALAPSPGMRGPRIPKRAAPPLNLPLGSRLGLSKPPEPMMSAAMGFAGSRGA